MQKDKQFRAIVRVEWECVFSEPNKEQAIAYLIDNFKEDYNLDITRKEIISLKVDK